MLYPLGSVHPAFGAGLPAFGAGLPAFGAGLPTPPLEILLPSACPASEISVSRLELVTVYGYDDAGKMTSIAHKNGADTDVDTINYVHDPLGRTSPEIPTQGAIAPDIFRRPR